MVTLLGTVSLLVLPVAQAADMTVSGAVTPILGLSFGSGDQAGTVPADITRERRGDVVIVTAFPR